MIPFILRVSTSDGMLSVPQELSEIIIGFMTGDTHTLKSCSLVCQSWFRASRALLFKRLSLDSDNYNHFFDSLQLNCARLPPFTQHCTSLDISCADEWLFNVNGAAYIDFVLHFSSSLVSLSIRHTTAPSFGHLISTILPFQSLRCFALDSVNWGKEAFHSTLIGPPRPSIDTIHVRNTDVSQFLALAPSTGLMDRIISLEVNPIKDVTFPELGKFILRHSSTIEHFTFGFEFASTSQSYVSQMEQIWPEDLYIPGGTHIQTRYRQLYGTSTCPMLGALSGIRVARIEGFLDSRQEVQNVALFLGPKSLSSFSSPVLTRLVLMMYLERAGQVDHYGVNWMFLDEIFSSESHEALKDVVFEIYGPADIAGLEDLLTTRLPRSNKRGILRFCSKSRQSRYFECPHHD